MDFGGGGVGAARHDAGVGPGIMAWCVLRCAAVVSCRAVLLCFVLCSVDGVVALADSVPWMLCFNVGTGSNNKTSLSHLVRIASF